jgi:hypothetical protein
MTRRAILANLDHNPPILTMRRLDAFTSQEFTILEMAEEQTTIWIARSPGAHIALDAAHALQRLGYLWPVSGAVAGSQHGWGFRITDDGRRALDIARARAAA